LQPTGLYSLKFFWWVPEFLFISARGRFDLSRSSKVIDVDGNRKRVCDFLLVRNSNLGPILYHFGDLTAFMCSWPPPLFKIREFLGCSRCTRSPTLGSASAWALSYLAVKLFSKNSNLRSVIQAPP